MDERKVRKNDTFHKISEQITRIEQIIEDLLKDIDINEMSAYQRLTMVHKFIGQHQKAIELQQTCIIDEPEKKASLLIGALMSQMRGDASRPEVNRVILVEEEDEGGKDD